MGLGQQNFRFLIGTSILLLALLLAACDAAAETTPPPTTVPQTTLMISGSGSVTPILSAIKPAFEADVPGHKLIVLSGTGTGGGVKGLIEGILDVAAMARPPKAEEAAQGVEYVEFGQSGTAIYTHRDVGVTNLTAAQVTAIFSGQVTNWSQVGGPTASIILYVRDEADSSTASLRQAFLRDTPFPETASVLTSQADMQAAVASTPASVGFGSWPSALAAGAAVQPITLDSIAPGDPAYPCLTPIGIGYLAARKTDVQPLIDWLLSPEGQAALRQFGVITTR